MSILPFLTSGRAGSWAPAKGCVSSPRLREGRDLFLCERDLCLFQIPATSLPFPAPKAGEWAPASAMWARASL